MAVKLGPLVVTRLTFQAPTRFDDNTVLDAALVCGYEAQLGGVGAAVKLDGALVDPNGKVTFPLASLPLVVGSNTIRVRTVLSDGRRSIWSVSEVTVVMELPLPNPPTLLSAE